ncbi:hypothetical protein VTO42DRAFT_2455 [Malbranchea cinnamomea]
MGLAGPRKRTKISHDPNNTAWSRSTTSYGHRIMTAQGWTPGSLLGAGNTSYGEHLTAASASHIRVILKDDNLGLGAKPKSKREDEPTGLDAFQDLLGRLNGKSDSEIAAEQRKREDVKLLGYVGMRWGAMNFVKGGYLVPDKMPESTTVEAREKEPESSSSSREETGVEEKKKSKETKKRKKDKKSKNGELDDASSGETEGKSKSKKDKKKNKKKKEKKTKEHKRDSSDSEQASDKASEKSSKNPKKRKRKETESQEDSSTLEKSSEQTERSESEVEPVAEAAKPPSAAPINGLIAAKERIPPARQVIRSKYIQQKKRALMDAKSLNEIFMVKS